MKNSYIEELFIKEEIATYGFDEVEQELFKTCIKATDCIFTASEIVTEKKYNEYIPLIESYVELADVLVYRYHNGYCDNAGMVVGLTRLLATISDRNGAYDPTMLQEARIKTYLNSYGWILNSDESVAISLDMDYLKFTAECISA